MKSIKLKKLIDRTSKFFTVLVIGVFFSCNLQAQVQELPLLVDFDGYVGTNLNEVFEGWSEAAGDPPAGTSASWFQSDVLFGDNHAAVEIYSNSHKEWIISPLFYVTENTQVSFDAAISYSHDEPRPGSMGGDDEFSLMVSTDGGTTYTPVYSFTNNSDIQLSYGFERYTFSLDDYSGSNVQIGFYASDGMLENGACAIHLDNIEIKNQRAYDASAVNIIQPAINNCYSEQQNVTVLIKNDGYETLNNIPFRVKVRGTNITNLFGVVNGPVTPGHIDTVQVGPFDMSETGDYDFTVQTELENDEYDFNDIYNRSILHDYVQNLPLEKLTFTASYENIGETYQGWNEYRGIGFPEIEMNTDWQTDDYNGEKGVSVYFSGIGTEDWLISPRFEPAANTKISFDYACDFGDGPTQMGSDDQVRIMVSTDCGGSWEMIDAMDNDFGVSGQWDDHVVDLSEYAGQTIRMAFYATTGTNQDYEQFLFFLDNIDIREMYTNDVGITRITSPGAPASFSASEEISVLVENFGTADIDNLEVSYAISGGAEVTETLTSTLTSKEVFEYTFAQTADLSGLDEVSIDVYTNLAEDENSANDGLYNQTLQTSSFNPGTEGTFQASFEPEEDLNGWFVVDNNADGAEWNIEENIEEAYTGTHSFAYSSMGTTAQSDDWLFSPAMEVVAGETYYVSFFFSNNAGNFPEKLRLDLTSAQNPDSVVQTLIDLGEIDNNAYLQAELEFTAPVTDKLHMAFVNYGEPDNFGMHLDQVEFRKVFDNDILVSDLDIPRQKDPETGELMDIDTAMVTISNAGINAVNDFTVYFEYNGNTLLSQSYTDQNILAGNQKTVVFDNGLNLPKDDIYDFKVWTVFASDENTANDSLFMNGFYLNYYFNSFESDDEVSDWLVVDVTGEGHTWEIVDNNQHAHSGTRSYELTTGTGISSNDDWLITEGFYLEAAKCYKVGFWYNAYYSEEKLTFLMGDEQNTTMQDTLTDFGVIGDGTYKEWVYHEVVVTVDADGQYYFGWNANGSLELARYKLIIDDFEFQQTFNFEPQVAFNYSKLDNEYYFNGDLENASWINWDFGDGQTANDEDVFHTFESNNSYDVVLTAGNACAEASVSETIDVTCDVTADFEYEIVEDTVTFTNVSTNADGYLWAFGDGTFSTEENPTHKYVAEGDYTVTLKAIGACGDITTQQSFTIDLTSIEDIAATNEITIYPNPVSNTLNIATAENTTIHSVEVINMAGQKVAKQEVNSNNFSCDLSGLSSGMYLINITTNEGYVNKLINKQ